MPLSPFLRTEHLGRTLEQHECLGSTNARALELAKSGATHGTTVWAQQQTEGRGQRGRSWFSPAGAGLYVSFVLRPDISPRLTPSLTLMAGVAVRAALAELSGAEIQLRWPNDLLAGPTTSSPGCKVGGILVEACADQTRLEYAVVGVGVNLLDSAYPEALKSAATSLEHIGSAPGLWETLGAICNELELAVTEMQAEGLAPAADRWTEHAVGLGQGVELIDGPRVVRGRLRGIAEDGALRLETPTGVQDCYRGNLHIPGIPKTPRAF